MEDKITITKEMIIRDIDEYPRSTQDERAERLGIHVSTFRFKVQKYRIKLPVKASISELKQDIEAFPDASAAERAERLQLSKSTIWRLAPKIKGGSNER